MKLYFSDAQEQLTPLSVMGSDQNSFILIHAFMYVLVTYKNEEYEMKIEHAKVIKTLYS